MATIQSIIKQTKIEDSSLLHYDVNYENFVVSVKAEDLTNPSDIAEVVTKANIKAAEIEAQVPSTASEEVQIPS